MLGTINPEILFLQQEDQIKAGLLDMNIPEPERSHRCFLR